MATEFRLLGEVEAWSDEQRLDIGTMRQRCVLAALLVDVNRPTTTDQLIARIWADDRPHRARNALAGYVSRLRRVITTGGDVEIGRASGGYVMKADPASIDLHRFRQLVAAARATADPGDADRLFREALHLWRGDPFVSLDTPWVNDVRTSLEAERVSVVLDANDSGLRADRHGELLPAIAAMAQNHPLDERVAGQLMLALYRCGRQADALETFRVMRDRLVEELGVDPSPALRRVHQQILDGVPEAASRAPVRTPPAQRNVGGEPIHSTPPTPPTVLTRYRPPTASRPLVERTRLIDTLRTGGPRRLLVIHGGAGFGKTTLATQWRHVLVAEGVIVAWLTIDGDDNDVVWFLAHLIDAVRTALPTLGEDLRQILALRGAEAERFVLTSLINEIDALGRRTCVIVDDWHRVTDASTIGALEYLLDHGGDQLQVLVTTRSRTGLPIGRMRVRDELVEIDAATLRFNVAEARAFLVDVCGLALDEADVANLEQTTDGWVAALQLASLSLRGQGDPAAFISRMSGRHHMIGEYLAENVLDSLEPEMLDFLLTTSLTERVNGDLASALAGVGNGQALLEAAEDRDLFLRRLDDEREWFRYHQLFAEFLQRRLQRDQPERITRLHAIASRWFADHKLLREAIHHAVAAGEDQRAVELIELHGTDVLQHTQMSTFQALMSNLPSHIAALSPRLQLTLGWADSLLRPAAAYAALDAFESAIERRSLPESELRDMRVEADVLRGVLNSWADRSAGGEELVTDCLSRPDSLPPFLVGTAVNVMSFVEIARFDFDAARRWQSWGCSYQQRTPVPFAKIYGDGLSGTAAREQLDVAEAERRFREGRSMAEQCGAMSSHAARYVSALLAEVLYERGEVAEAERLLDECRQHGPVVGPVDLLIALYIVGARIDAVRGNPEDAASRLDEGDQIAATLGLTRFRAHVENERTRLKLPGGAGPNGNADNEPVPTGGLGEITAQIRDETEILRLLDDQPDLACHRAQAWVERLEPTGRPRALLQARRLLVAAMNAAGRTQEAKQTLAVIGAQCAELGLVRYLLDGGPRLIALLSGLRDDIGSGQWNPAWHPVPRHFLDIVLSEAREL
ncbi:BTAD domain-containing putative transcriptional regulator [Mycobacterium deserti]|uniref:AAA family ATPase n=1 Tax=Mycobacterium deserti TaxID=2978347 RepID=A0ABT2MIV1_9MYCO|nr:BTAD domain-containing putative transcriptional regulator [Mycobacterium deserti]MCT7661330.1 AAA family ATPase [Mycobacterium deserti]